MTAAEGPSKADRTGVRLPGLMELRSLRARLASKSGAALAEAWPKLAAFERVVWFKLLEPDRALRFFPLLGLDDQLLLIEAADLQSVAPVLEEVPEAKAEFHELKAWQREELVRLAREARAKLK